VTEVGPWGWENWRAMRDGRLSQGGLEVACYTDAQIVDDRAEFGPYLLLNPRRDFDQLLSRRPGVARLGLVLRLELHREIDHGDFLDSDWDQTDQAVFHGGDAAQELAGLVSLALGIRLRASGISREFDPEGDPRGYPYGFDEQVPYLPPPYRNPILPYTATGSARLDTCRQLLLAYPSLSAAQARALVRAARSYQEGLWIADTDPRQAWLRLVGAVEAVERQWFRDQEQIGLTKELKNIKGRTTKRFVNFVMTFPLKPPRRRPKALRLNWSQMENHLTVIYDKRSRDLHDGIPFPLPMCQPPYRSARGIASEIPDIPPVTAWTLADAPMLLHTFVRNALHAWWSTLAPVQE
jgi:hypothetical protein